MKRTLALATAALIAFAVPALAASTQQVSVRNFSFGPRTLSIARGTTVVWRWVNTQGIRHDVHVTGGPVSFSSAKKTSGTYNHVFNRAGTYHLICTVHPDMTETITVH
jgi:plastocyanin